MASQPKTIQIFLPDGNARSLRIAEITSRTIQAIQVPRSKVNEADVRTEIQQVGVYFLFGNAMDGAKPLVYIGEAGDCLKRLRQHNQQKDFWTTAVAVTSKTRTFDKAQAQYLEWRFIRRARDIGRYQVENTTVPREPYVSEQTRADLDDYIGTTRILLSTLGFPLLEELAHSHRSKAKESFGQSPIENNVGEEASQGSEDTNEPQQERPAYDHTEILSPPATSEPEQLYCERNDVKAEGVFNEDGFLVFAGSEARLKELKSCPASASDQRKRLRNDGILVRENEQLVFTEDFLFNSPSAAACAVLAHSANGWTEWKNKAGKTLKLLQRS